MPLKSLFLPALRTAGTATVAQWDGTGGLGISTFSISTTNAGGFYAAPLVLPEDADPSYPMNVYQVIRNPATMITTSRVIVFEPRICYANPGNVPINLGGETSFGSPDFWAAGEWTEIRFAEDTTPDDPTIPAHTLEPGAVLGFRSYRDPNHAGDNFPHAIQLLAGLRLEYHPRCQMGCCL